MTAGIVILVVIVAYVLLVRFDTGNCEPQIYPCESCGRTEPCDFCSGKVIEPEAAADSASRTTTERKWSSGTESY